jgi:hypothetical protein
MVRTDMITTPPATSRADTSLTGLGKENSDRTLLGVVVVIFVIVMLLSA